MYILDFNPITEKTNVENNVKHLIDTLSAQKDSLHSFSFIDVYGAFSPRLQSALMSMVHLYNNGEVEYSQLSFYLALHDRLVNQFLSIIEIQVYRKLSVDDYEIRTLIRKVDSLVELAEQL